MLVSAFAGKERTLRAYKEAVEKSYRFFSFGEQCLFYNEYEIKYQGESSWLSPMS